MDRLIKKLGITDSIKGLILLSILSVVLTFIRIYFKGSHNYIFLIWNLFLAWIPLFLTNIAAMLNEKSKSIYPILFAWLLFFPNSAYLITDLLHLNDYSHNIIWFDSLLIFLFAFTGLLISFKSLKTAQRIFNNLFGKIFSWALVTIIFFLSGFGIYLGRFARLNSWHIVNHPFRLAKVILTQYNNPLSIQVTLTYGFVIFVIYIIFYKYFKTEKV